MMRGALVAGFLVLSAAIFIRHAWSLSHRRNALDHLGAGLSSVRALIPDGRLLGFATDAQGDERKELIHRAQFLLAPRILDQAQGITDTILVINGDRWLAAQSGHRVLVDEQAGPDRILLVESPTSR